MVWRTHKMLQWRLTKQEIQYSCGSTTAFLQICIDGGPHTCLETYQGKSRRCWCVYIIHCWLSSPKTITDVRYWILHKTITNKKRVTCRNTQIDLVPRDHWSTMNWFIKTTSKWTLHHLWLAHVSVTYDYNNNIIFAVCWVYLDLFVEFLLNVETVEGEQRLNLIFLAWKIDSLR